MKKMIITGFLLLTGGFRRSERLPLCGDLERSDSAPINNAPILIRGTSYESIH